MANSVRQNRTFLPYLRGIDPEALRIGSLYLNPLNPDDGLEDKRFEFMQGEEQKTYEEALKRYCWREQRDDRRVSLQFSISKETAVGFRFSQWLHIDGDVSGKVDAVLEGQKGRRLKLHYPSKFLKEKVMTQEGCDEWIRTQASISYKGKFGLHKWKAPEVWMCTGLQLVTGGDVYAAGSREKSVGGGVGGDPSIAAGLPPGTLEFKIDAEKKNSNNASTGFGFDDERVWAAQFMELELEYGDDADLALQKREHSKDLLPKTIADLRLKDIADLGAKGIRGMRADADAVKPPKRRARVIADQDLELPEDDVKFDETGYIEALKDISWRDRNDAARYLEDEARSEPVSD